MRLFILIGITLSALIGGIAGCAPVTAYSPPIAVTADGSLSAAQLADVLPLDLSFSNSMGTAQIADLSHALDIEAPNSVTRYAAGDVLYWPSRHRIVIPSSNGGALPAGGLILIGRITSVTKFLNECRRSCSIALVADVHDG
jgi:hypothetical protein